jgi:hypothetical protein
LGVLLNATVLVTAIFCGFAGVKTARIYKSVESKSGLDVWYYSIIKFVHNEPDHHFANPRGLATKCKTAATQQIKPTNFLLNRIQMEWYKIRQKQVADKTTYRHKTARSFELP